MKSLTFVIPVRIDNANRWDNLLTCIKYLTQTFHESEIILVEDSQRSDCASLCNDCGIRYLFINNNSNFSRSNAINQALKIATREYVMPFDLDILICEKQIRTSIRIMEKGNIHIILPHNFILIDVCDSLKSALAKSLNLKLVPRFRCMLFHRKKPDMNLLCSGSGVAIFRRSLLIKIGGFNKKLRSYGWEDTEVLKRASKLGIYYYYLCWGNIIHFHHERGPDSIQNELYEVNKKEFLAISAMKTDDLINYIQNELAIDHENYFSIHDYKHIKRHNLYHLNYLFFTMNRTIKKILETKFS